MKMIKSLLINLNLFFCLYIMDDKIQVIKQTYETNFGTAYEVYKELVKKDSSIRLQDVKDYLNSREDKQINFKYKKYNSFISPGANFEYEVDLMFINSNDENIGLVGVDNFTKLASIVIIKNKKPDEIINGLKHMFDKLGGKPKQLYSDEEGAFNSKIYQKFLNQNNIKHIQTTTHAHTVERFIATFRMNLQRRLDALNQDKSKWIEHVDSILNKYNNTEHSTIKIKPVEAGKPYNRMWVWWHINNEVKRDRKYPKINVGNMVRIKINPKRTAKGYEPTFTKEVYKVVAIKDNEYFIPSYHKHRMWNRHELLKV
jgi:ribosomal protein L21E